MAKADGFYGTQVWKKCREAYKQSVGGLCEKCLAKGELTPGEIVHHKIHLDEESMKDPDIALCWDNLELVCRKCHEEEHPEKARSMHEKRWQRRYRIDGFGRVSPR